MKKIDWYDFYLVITEMMPEFKFVTFDVHKNTEVEAQHRFLNKYKLEQIEKFFKKYKKNKKVSAGDLFLLKLELAEMTYKYNNRGKKTMEEAIAIIKDLATNL